MKANAEVTTIIRTYNRCASTLCAIESAIGQSLSEQPIIVVDDGSTDNVVKEICDKFGSRVRVIRHLENKGVGAAANTGLAAVETPYAAFLDSDDLWEHDFLRLMLSAIKASPGTTLVYCDIRFEFPEHALDYAVSMKEPDVIESSLQLPPFTMSSILFRTRSAQQIGPFSENREIGEDSDFYIRLWLRAPASFEHVRHDLTRHRIWSGNTTRDPNTLIKELDSLLRQYLRHPYFRHLENSYAQVTRQRLMGVAARRQVDKWLNSASRRTISLIITDVRTVADLLASLNSVASQTLPPVDVAVVVECDKEILPEINNTAEEAWPFVVKIVSVRAGSSLGEKIQYAMNVLSGGMVLFLCAGEEFMEGALGFHRHAFSCSPQSVLMSYGGVKGAIPDSLPIEKNAKAIRIATHSIPISLSTIAVSKKALLTPNVIPKKRKEGFFLNLILNLLAGSGPVVRISKPVVYASEKELIPRAVLEDIVLEVSETDICHDMIGAFDQILDSCGNEELELHKRVGNIDEKQ